MSVVQFRDRVSGILDRIWETQTGNIQKVSAVMADCVANRGLVHLFGN